MSSRSTRCCRPIRRHARMPCRRARRRRAGSSSPAGSTRSAMPARVSPSTMRGRATRFGSTRFASPPTRFAAATISNSLPRAAIAGRNSGCRRAGRRCSSRAGRRRSTGVSTTAHGGSSPCRASARSTRPNPFAMSASTRPTLLRVGRISACRPRPNGKSRRAISRSPAISATAAISTPVPMRHL